jgi:hypothetical protein
MEERKICRSNITDRSASPLSSSIPFSFSPCLRSQLPKECAASLILAPMVRVLEIRELTIRVGILCEPTLPGTRCCRFSRI